VEIFHSGQLLGSNQVLEAVQRGQIDAGIAALNSGVDERFALFELPFVTSADESGARSAWQIYEDHFQNNLVGVKALATFVRGVDTLLTNEPVVLPDDLEGLRIRSVGQVGREFLESTGASPASLAFAEVYSALQTGIIDAVSIAPHRYDFVEAGFDEVVDNLVVFDGVHGLSSLLSGFVINEEFYNSLPADLRQVIDNNSGLELSAMAGAMLESFAAENIQAMEQAGVSVNRLNEVQMDAWRDAARPTIDAVTTDISASGFDAETLADSLGRGAPAELYFVVRSELGVNSVDDLDGATICFPLNSEAEALLAELFNARGLSFEPVIFAQEAEVRTAFLDGRADVYITTDPQLAAEVEAEAQMVGFSARVGSGDTGDGGASGTDGDDVFQGSSESEHIDGGAGYDVLIYDVDRNNVDVQLLSGGTVEITKPGGTDTLVSIERIEFDDGVLVFDIDSDNLGFNYWIEQMEAGLNRAGILIQFAESPENLMNTAADLSEGVWLM